MTRKQPFRSNDNLREDFQCYLADHHLTNDTIAALSGAEARDVLRAVWAAAPFTLSKVLAVEFPLDAERFDAIEGRIQEQLPTA